MFNFSTGNFLGLERINAKNLSLSMCKKMIKDYDFSRFESYNDNNIILNRILTNIYSSKKKLSRKTATKHLYYLSNCLESASEDQGLTYIKDLTNKLIDKAMSYEESDINFIINNDNIAILVRFIMHNIITFEFLNDLNLAITDLFSDNVYGTNIKRFTNNIIEFSDEYTKFKSINTKSNEYIYSCIACFDSFVDIIWCLSNCMRELKKRNYNNEVIFSKLITDISYNLWNIKFRIPIFVIDPIIYEFGNIKWNYHNHIAKDLHIRTSHNNTHINADITINEFLNKMDS